MLVVNKWALHIGHLATWKPQSILEHNSAFRKPNSTSHKKHFLNENKHMYRTLKKPFSSDIPILDLVSACSSNWQPPHARVGGGEALNLEANYEMVLFRDGYIWSIQHQSSQVHTRYHRGLCKINTVSICRAEILIMFIAQIVARSPLSWWMQTNLWVAKSYVSINSINV